MFAHNSSGVLIVFTMSHDFFLKVINEETISEVSLDELKGGATCTCNNGATFSCSSFGCTCFQTLYECKCNGNVSLTITGAIDSNFPKGILRMP